MGCICGKDSVKIDGRRFNIQRCIGEGGFSMVYLVKDDKSGELYAMKKIACHSERDRKRAEQEIRLHQMLANNENVLSCEVSSIGKIEGDQSLVYSEAAPDVSISVEAILILPYCRRGTLQDELSHRLKTKDFIPEARVLSLFLGICKGISAFHSLKPIAYVHRDIKPANVLIKDDDSPTVMDLGSVSVARVIVKDSREAQALQDSAAEHCSMPYRAPELFHIEAGSELDERTDVWSLGCLLYALCFFQSPFEAVYERGDSIALAVMSGKFQIPTTSIYSAALHQLITSVLEVDFKRRPFVENIIKATKRLIAVSQVSDIDVNV